MIRVSFGIVTASLVSACAVDSGSSGPVDQCGASTLQWLQGKAETVLYDTRLPEGRRIIHPDTAVTRDYRADRLNIHIDAQGRITLIACG